MTDKFRIVGTVEKVEAAYDGYGDTKTLKGATVTAVFFDSDTRFKFEIEIPKGSIDVYPTVGDEITVAIA